MLFDKDEDGVLIFQAEANRNTYDMCGNNQKEYILTCWVSQK